MRQKLPPLSDIQKVEFYKIDEIATDLICCEISYIEERLAKALIFNEEDDDFGSLDRQLASLVSYDTDWRSKVVHPPFEHCHHIAFQR